MKSTVDPSMTAKLTEMKCATPTEVVGSSIFQARCTSVELIAGIGECPKLVFVFAGLIWRSVKFVREQSHESPTNM